MFVTMDAPFEFRPRYNIEAFAANLFVLYLYLFFYLIVSGGLECVCNGLSVSNVPLLIKMLPANIMCKMRFSVVDRLTRYSTVTDCRDDDCYAIF